MTIDEQIAVLQAAKAGKVIEFKVRDSANAGWSRWCSEHFDFIGYEYRIKREPREFWVYQDERRSISGYPLTKREPSEAQKRAGIYVKFREVMDGEQ